MVSNFAALGPTRDIRSQIFVFLKLRLTRDLSDHIFKFQELREILGLVVEQILILRKPAIRKTKFFANPNHRPNRAKIKLHLFEKLRKNVDILSRKLKGKTCPYILILYNNRLALYGLSAQVRLCTYTYVKVYVQNSCKIHSLYSRVFILVYAPSYSLKHVLFLEA